MQQICARINGRIDHIVDFESSEHIPFIIGRHTNTVELLSLYEDPNNNKNCDIIMQLDADTPHLVYAIKTNIVKAASNDKRHFVLEITLGDKKQIEEGTKEDDVPFDVTYESRDDSTKFTLHMQDDMHVQIDVVFKYVRCIGANKIEKKAFLDLFVTQNEHIADAVIDFGSEASQVAVFTRNDDQDSNGIQEVFPEMYEMICGQKCANRTSFVQNDEGHEGQHLFRSVFFAKNDFDKSVLKEACNNVIPVIKKRKQNAEDGEQQEEEETVAENKVLSMITSRDEQKELLAKKGFIRLPNIKLLGFGGIPQPRVNGIKISSFEKRYFYNAPLNRFILYALKKSVDLCDNCQAVSLNILMPNIYGPRDVNERLAMMRSSVPAIINANEELQGIKLVEISAISESDASLLGADTELNNPMENRFLQGLYLILDAGKGTLDFSIVDVDHEEGDDFECLHRGGIIGAGNAITTAYLFALLRQMCLTYELTATDEKLCKWIYDNVFAWNDRDDVAHADLAEVNELMQSLNTFKVCLNWRESSAQPPKKSTTKNLADFNLSDFTSFINHTMIEDDNRVRKLQPEAQVYVDRMIAYIVGDISDRLKFVLGYIYQKYHKKLSGVVFSGRGFCHKQLKQEMQVALKAHDFFEPGASTDLAFTGGHLAFTMKNVCLYISARVQQGFYNGRMINTPLHLAFRGAQAVDSPSKKTAMMRLLDFSRDFFKRGGKHQEELPMDEQAQDNNRYGNKSNYTLFSVESDNDGYATVDNSGNYLIYGMPITVNSKNDIILIGGVEYQAPKNIRGNMRIFYTANDIVARSENGQVETLERRSNVNMKTSDLEMATMFPELGKLDNCSELQERLLDRWFAHIDKEELTPTGDKSDGTSGQSGQDSPQKGGHAGGVEISDKDFEDLEDQL